MLAMEIYKAKNSLSSPIIRNIFPINGGSYSLRNTSYFKLPRPNTVHNGLESVKYLGPKIWSILPQELQKNLPSFKEGINNWKLVKCPYKLFKTFVPDIGYL